MRVILLAAMTNDRLIGSGGKIPWHETEDLRFFKQTTMGHAIIMGRKTFDSIERALPGRRNIVITRNKGLTADGMEVVHSLEDALSLCRKGAVEKAFVIGGGEIYIAALPIAHEMMITFVEQGGLSGDTYFPEWDPAEWETASDKSVSGLRFVTYQRAGK